MEQEEFNACFIEMLKRVDDLNESYRKTDMKLKSLSKEEIDMLRENAPPGLVDRFKEACDELND